MEDVFKSELIAFLNLSDEMQYDILDEFNGDSSDSIGIFDIIPKNIERSSMLQDFVKFLTLTKDRHKRRHG
ncbi:MAG: hypothetical protein GY756_03395 [bacterium]|nr:hypothetical protein [bacterium]